MIARVAAVTASVLALVATVAAASAVPGAGQEMLVVELWRVVGLATWVALFIVLAVSPSLLAVWLIALGSKLALVALGLILGTGVPGAADLTFWDGVLSVVLAAGMVSALLARRRDRAGADARIGVILTGMVRE